METQGMNLFIVDANEKTSKGLQQSLYNRFGKSLDISTFSSGESCLEKVDANTRFVVLAYFLESMNGNEILKKIKAINPKTEVVMMSSNTNAVDIIESLRGGATDYLVKGDTAWRRLVPYVYRAIAEPIRRFGNEYGAVAYMAMFLIAFASVSLGSYLIFKYLSS
jgi:DNA-binding NtrC family response regulator